MAGSGALSGDCRRSCCVAHGVGRATFGGQRHGRRAGARRRRTPLGVALDGERSRTRVLACGRRAVRLIGDRLDRRAFLGWWCRVQSQGARDAGRKGEGELTGVVNVQLRRFGWVRSNVVW